MILALKKILWKYYQNISAISPPSIPDNARVTATGDTRVTSTGDIRIVV